MRNAELDLTLLTDGTADVDVSWSHSSDLDDPSPFLDHGHMLLTTGRQFAAYTSDDYSDYVSRLISAGVVAIGFGTEVIRSGTPPELLRACRAAGLALVEVPYATPFIAVGKHIADRLAAQSRERLEWTLTAQDEISKSVLRSGDLAMAIRTASELLACDIGVLDPDGTALEGSTSGWLRERALYLLSRDARARDGGSDHGLSWAAQTLGRSGHLLGVIVTRRATPFTPNELSVATLVAALTELSLAHAEDQRLAFRSLSRDVLRMLRDGQVSAVEGALQFLPAQLPQEPILVIAVAHALLSSRGRASLERMAAGRTLRLLVAENDDNVVLLVDSASRSRVQEKLSELRIAAGISRETEWTGLDDAMTQASSALAGAEAGQQLSFDEFSGRSVLGLLSQADVARRARTRLRDQLLTVDRRSRLREAAVWLQCNGAWEPAAEQLGMHRHTLKRRVTELGNDLGLPLDSFGSRAELWAMLVALNLSD